MDTEIGVLAAELGRAIVQAMISEGWAALRPRLGRVLRRARAEHLVAALGTDAAALGAGRLPADVAAGRWAGRIEGLLHQHPELLNELSDVLAAIRAEASGRPDPHGAPVVIRQTAGNRSQVSAAGRDIVNSHNRTDNRKRISFGGIGIVVAVVAVLLLTGGVVVYNVVGSGGGSRIDADTSCADFLRAPQAERDQAVRRIALEMDVSGAGHPWLLNNVDYACGHQPESRLGDVVARQQY